MLEQLSQLINQFGQSAVVENSAVPNEHNAGVMQEAQSAIVNGLQGLAAQGNTSQLAKMLQNPQAINAEHPAVQNIAGSFLNNITEKFGINKETATQIASSIIPSVLSKFATKANDPNDSSINLTNILGSLTGGAGGGSMISQLGKSFLDKDKDGDVDLNDVKGLFS
jgi:hypothetical protein